MSDSQKSYPNTDAHKARGDWNPLWDTFRSAPQAKGPLPPENRELILVAINAATTQFVLRFDDGAEAIRLANDTEHGLAAGIFTRDSARSLRVTKKVKAGISWANTYRTVSPIAEFGGVKTSGSVDEYLQRTPGQPVRCAVKMK